MLCLEDLILRGLYTALRDISAAFKIAVSSYVIRQFVNRGACRHGVRVQPCVIAPLRQRLQ